MLSSLSRSFSDLVLTKAAANKLKQILPDVSKHFLRVGVETGGCAGFAYSFKIDDAPLEGDHVETTDGVSLHVDAKSFPYMMGSTIDFFEEPFRSYFKVADNPNAQAGCSCGESFSVGGPVTAGACVAPAAGK